MAAHGEKQDRPEYAHCQQLAEDVANLLAPQSGAYYDVWLDGEKFFSAQMEVGFVPAASPGRSPPPPPPPPYRMRRWEMLQQPC